MELFLSSHSPAAREQAIIFQQTHERMRGAITPVIAAKLQWMRDAAIARFTSATLTSPDFSTLRNSPSALFWCVREPDLARLRPLSSLFFTLLLEQLAAFSTESGHAIPVNLFLDEFANIGLLPFFDTTISLARGRNLSIWLGIQSLSQLTARYGRANAQTILTNCATKIALSGLDVETAEYFSRSLGQKTECVPRRTYQKRRFALLAMHTSDTLHEVAPSALYRRRGAPDRDRTGARDCGEPSSSAAGAFPLTPLPPRTAPTDLLGPARSLPLEAEVPAVSPASRVSEPARPSGTTPRPESASCVALRSCESSAQERGGNNRWRARVTMVLAKHGEDRE